MNIFENSFSHVTFIALRLSSLRISSKTLSIESNLVLDWSHPLMVSIEGHLLKMGVCHFFMHAVWLDRNDLVALY